MAKPKTIRMLTSMASANYDIRARQLVRVPAKTAADWIGRGMAEEPTEEPVRDLCGIMQADQEKSDRAAEKKAAQEKADARAARKAVKDGETGALAPEETAATR